jgi:AraC-like DNA-binding protein
MVDVPVKKRRFASELGADLNVSCEHAPSTTPHAHEFFEVGFVTRGRAVHHIGRDREASILAGDLFVIDPYRAHFYSEVCQLEVLYLLMAPAMFRQNMREIQAVSGADDSDFSHLGDGFRSALCLSTGGCFREIQRILARIRQEFQDQRRGYELLVKALLVELFVTLGRLVDAPSWNEEDGEDSTEHRVEIVRSFLEEHYSEKVRLPDLARLACLQQQYLCRVFKRQVGTTIFDYLNHVRIRQACELLNQTGDSVTGISLRTGFNDLSHFIRTFRKVVGLAPSQYRKKSRFSNF